MLYDTVNPLRILNAVKRFLVNLGERGETIVNDPSSITEKWQDSLPDDIKADPIFEKYKEPAEAHRALVAAQKFLGREKLPVPIDENDTETYNMIFTRLGLPESKDKYVLPTDLEIPKDLPMDDTLIESFKDTAHKLGILPKQFAGLYKWYMSEAINSFNKISEQSTSNIQETENALRKKWGAAYGQNVALAKKVFQSFVDDKTSLQFDEKGYGNDPILIELFANLGKVLSEDQLVGKPKGLTLTPDEAQAEINKIKSDMNHPYWKAEHPMHAEAVANMERLMKLATITE